MAVLRPSLCLAMALILMSNVAVIIVVDNLMLTLNSVMNGPSPGGSGEWKGGGQ